MAGGRSSTAAALLVAALHALQQASAATIDYSYTDTTGAAQATAAEIVWPAAKPTGDILHWHGTGRRR